MRTWDPKTYSTLLVKDFDDIFALDCAIADHDETDRRDSSKIDCCITDYPDSSRPLFWFGEILDEWFYQCLFMQSNGIPRSLKVAGGCEGKEIRYNSCGSIDGLIAGTSWLELVRDVIHFEEMVHDRIHRRLEDGMTDIQAGDMGPVYL